LIAPLPSGFRNLVLNYRLSVPVITLIHRCQTKAQYIDQIDASSSGVLNAMNLQETEYAVRLLACTDLTVIERAICIGMLISILDSTRTERFSQLYVGHMQHHAEELCLWQAMFEDNDLFEFYLWAAMDIAGTMLPPKMPSLSPNYMSDKRFKLLMVVMKRYEYLGWSEVLKVCRQFFAKPRCVESWYNSWQLGLKHLHELGL